MKAETDAPSRPSLRSPSATVSARKTSNPIRRPLRTLPKSSAHHPLTGRSLVGTPAPDPGRCSPKPHPAAGCAVAVARTNDGAPPLEETRMSSNRLTPTDAVMMPPR